MQDLTPSGKTIVETADSAVYRHPVEVTATSALWESATTSTNHHSEQSHNISLHSTNSPTDRSSPPLVNPKNVQTYFQQNRSQSVSCRLCQMMNKYLHVI